MTRPKRTPPGPTPEQTHRAYQQGKFLAMLAQRGNIREACEAAGAGRRTVYEWRETDPTFAAAWADALEDACDGLETAAWVRARKQSDTLLIFLLKAHRPALYRETTRTELSNPDGTPLTLAPTVHTVIVKLTEGAPDAPVEP